SGDRVQAEAIAAPARSVAVPVRHRDQPSADVEGPRVVEAGERAGRPAILAAHHGAPVGTTVEEGADRALPVPDQHEGPSTHRPSNIAARLRDLGLVTDVEPAPVEHASALEVEELW